MRDRDIHPAIATILKSLVSAHLSKYLNVILLGCLIILTFFFTLREVVSISGKSQSEGKALKLKVTSSKEVFLLAEIVPLTFRLTNEGTDSIRFAGDLDVRSGNLKILISQDGKNYKRYFRSDWGVVDRKAVSILLEPTESLESSTKILWNSIPRVTNLNELSEKQLITNFAFTSEGAYFLKASFSTHSSNKTFEIESEPVLITIEKPVGEDLEVWNIIKDNGDIAYFLQEGDFRISSYKPEVREKLQQEIKQILVDHPNSFYAQPFKQSLEKFQVIEEKRKAFEEKMKANKPN